MTRNEATDDPSEEPRDDAHVDDAELIDALRLAEALDRVEAGHDSGLDAMEDPELTGLLRAATLLRGELRGAGDGHAYRSFRTRSRAAVLHALEAPVVEAVPANIIPFYRRLMFVRPFAAVAAAAAIALAVIGGASWPARGGDGGNANVATNLTSRSTADELDQLAATLADIKSRTRAGQSVPLPLLRALSEGTARFANLIEQMPEQVSTETVRTYIKAAQAGTTVLTTATVEHDAQGALAAAQRAARDGVVVATRYLDASPATAPASPANASPANASPANASPANASPATAPAGVTPAAAPSGTVTPANQAAAPGSAPSTTTGETTGAPKPPAAAATSTSAPASAPEANDIVR